MYAYSLYTQNNFQNASSINLSRFWRIFFSILKKGMGGQKIKATFSVIKNLKKINQKYNQIQKTRKQSDKEIIKNFQGRKFKFQDGS